MLVRQSGNYGDIKEYKIELDGNDISEHVQNVMIHFSIFNFLWSAELMIIDSYNMISRLPIRRASEVKITLETELDSITDERKEWSFIIQSINSKQYPNAEHTSYILNLIDDKFIKNQSNLISKAYTAMPHHAIVNDIVTEGLGSRVSTHASDNNITCIIPSWTPFEAVSWISKSSVLKENADFLFYQSDDDEFKFVSFTELYKNNKQNIEFNRKPTLLQSINETDYDYTFNIGKLLVDHFDMALEANRGYFGAVTTIFDIDTKDYQDFDSKPLYGSRKVSDATDLHSIKETNRRLYYYNPELFDEGENIYASVNQWSPSRMYFSNVFDSEKIIIQSTGGVGVYQFLGSTCKVNIPDQDNELDDSYTGDYLISDITFHINRNAFMVNYGMINRDII